MKTGFTLVELSIVLVILGLLVGGVLTGQSLVRASELNAVATEYNKYVTAANSFREKYFALPGDMPNATSFWGSAGGNGANGTCQGFANAVSTCNGDSDGYIDIINSNSVSESSRFWQHLSFSGLIEGKYTGAQQQVNGITRPTPKLSDAAWLVIGNAAYTPGDTFGYSGNYGNSIDLYGASSGNPLKPIEAWNIDLKLDDGLPGSGKIYGTKGNGTTVICTTGDNLAPPADDNATYVVSRASKDCGLIFLRAM